MDELEKKRRRLQKMMVFLGSVSSATEKIFGASAGVMTNRAGKQLGAKSIYDRPQLGGDDLVKAVEELQEALQEIGLMWKIEPWKKSDEADYVREENGKKKINLVFRDCMVRNTLYCYGHPQEEALCQMAHGYFAGAVEQLTGGKADLAILHAGENACFKELTWEAKT